MARHYTVDDVLAYMEIPLPEDDDLSDEDFDGYLDEHEKDEDDGDDGGWNSDAGWNDGNDDGGDGNYDGSGGGGEGSDDGSGGGGEGSDDGSDGGSGGGGDGRGDGGGDGGSDGGSDGSFYEIPEFVDEPGCTQDMSNKSPLEFLSLFITDKILKGIVEQTNLFAQQFIDSHELPPRSRVRQWGRSSHDVAELRRFLSLTIIMGLVSYPTIEDSWVTSWPFATTTFNSIMMRDRFSLIMRFLHLNDSSKYIPKGQPGYDALYKLRPFADPLISNFQSAFSLGREISVDESMIGFKGRLWFIQYMPKKPTKWGMKAFVLADSVTGYTYNWRLYTGMKVM